jgi:FKBP-type peptidyl-prolyl cis-trans isomerase
MKIAILSLLSLSLLGQSVSSFSLPSSTKVSASTSTSTTTSTLSSATSSNNNNVEVNDSQDILNSRRNVMKQILSSTTAAALVLGGGSNEAQALVEGNKPPTKFKTLPEEYMQGTLTLSEMDSKAAVPDSAYKKLPSGVIIADLRVGNGDVEITEGSRVNLQWVLRKSNGYFVDSSAVQNDVPFIFTVGDKSAIFGVDEGVKGMRAGGTRRLLIPPSLAYVQGLEDGLPGPLPAGFGPRQQMRRVQGVRKDVPGEYVFLEVQVTRVR